MINHRKGNQVNVHTPAEPDGVQRTKGDTFPVNKDEGFFGQQAAHVELDSAVPAIANVQVRGSARLLRQKSCQVSCIADAQFFDVCRTIRIHWVRADFFRGRNVRARHNDLNYCSDTGGLLTECHRGLEQAHCHNAPPDTPDKWPRYDKLLSLVLALCNKMRDKQQVSFRPTAQLLPSAASKQRSLFRSRFEDARRPPLQHNDFIGPHSVKHRADREPETTLAIPAGSRANLVTGRQSTRGQ